MMKTGMLVVALGTLGVVAAACSGGGSSADTSLKVTTGTFTQVTTSASPNTCGGSNYFVGVTSFDVTANATSLDITEGSLGGPYTYDITSNTSLTDNGSASSNDFDFTDPVVAVSNNGFSKTYDCVINQSGTFTGTITAHDKFTLTDDYATTITSGTECAAVATTASILSGSTIVIPCEDAYIVSMKK